MRKGDDDLAKKATDEFIKAMQVFLSNYYSCLRSQSIKQGLAIAKLRKQNEGKNQ